MRKEANDFLKICDILDRDYKKTDGNKFRYAKTYLEQNVGPDYDQLKSLHAEVTDEKASDASIVSCLCVFGISHFGLYYLYSSTMQKFLWKRQNKS